MYKCLCCGLETLPAEPENAVAFICPVCWWENDVFIRTDDDPSDENRGMSLNQARENYKKYGIATYLTRVKPNSTPIGSVTLYKCNKLLPISA